MSQQLSDPKKRISCKRCQDRKIKCSRIPPCHRCTAAGVRCEFRGDGTKRAPISREYVAALENRLGSLESFLLELKTTSSCDPVYNFQGPELLEQPGLESLPTTFENPISSVRIPAQNNEVYAWPRGLSQSSLLQHEWLPNQLPRSSHDSAIYDNAGEIFSSSIIAECVALFFRWQYPYCLFIDRDEFLLGYLKHSCAGKHPAPALEYGICALGALMSPDKLIFDLAGEFSLAAAKLLDCERISTPRDNSVQALLCCSFFQAAQGNFSQAWMHSGIAFRMSEYLLATDISGEHSGRSQSTPRDTRWRTHRNCYESDKFICELLGKAPTLREYPMSPCWNDAPNNSFPVWTSWLAQNGLSNPDNLPSLFDVNATTEKRLELCRIINDIYLQTSQSGNFEPSARWSTQRWTELVINDLNTRLLRWKDSLPPDIRWRRWGSNQETLCPHVSTLHILYHLTRLHLNIPFLSFDKIVNGDLPTSLPKVTINALDICKESIDATFFVIRRFKTQYSLRTAPLFFVQGTIAAADASIAITRFEGFEQPAIYNFTLQALDEILKEMSDTWPIAGHARLGLQNSLMKNRIGKSPTQSNISTVSENMGSPYVPAYATQHSYGQSIFDSGLPIPMPPYDLLNSDAWHSSFLVGDLQHSWEDDTNVGLCNGSIHMEDRPGDNAFSFS